MRGAGPPSLGYQGYPATVCVSINEELVHGIPGDRVIQEGDIVSIDLAATYKGYVGDTAVTLGVGRIKPEAQRLIDVTREALWRGIRGPPAGGGRRGAPQRGAGAAARCTRSRRCRTMARPTAARSCARAWSSPWNRW